MISTNEEKYSFDDFFLGEVEHRRHTIELACECVRACVCFEILVASRWKSEKIQEINSFSKNSRKILIPLITLKTVSKNSVNLVENICALSLRRGKQKTIYD